MANSITLRDVADLAGVSIGTASQALNNRPNVAAATRARVIDAAVTLGYPVKDKPVSTKRSELSVVGLLTKHDFGLPLDVNPFYSHVQMGVESECRKSHLSLMYANIEVDVSNRPVMWPLMISEQQVDGLIMAGTFIEDTVDLLQRKIDIPIVLVDSYAPNLPFDSIVIDNITGACEGVAYLLDQGHTHIGLIGFNEESPPSIQERWKGYIKTLQEQGMEDLYIEASGLSRESGYEVTQRLLQRAPEITAIFACNDLTAIGALHAARDMDLAVPDDLSVMGFDNIDLAKEISPALTTIHVHKTWLGVLGVRQLMARAQSPDEPRVTILLDTELIVRDSVGPCRGR
jgi:LacI family transcriptional regulator